MKLFWTICILLALSEICLAEDLIFFADDHYKALGQPLLKTSVPNPVLFPDEAILRINLTNIGQMEELVSMSDNGSKEDIGQEMEEEMHSVDAFNIRAELKGEGPLDVIDGPKSIEHLPSGDVVGLQFNVSIEKGSNGWFELPLRLDYERYADVSVIDGIVSPMYLQENASTRIRVLVTGASNPFEILGIKSELQSGAKGSLTTLIRNNDNDTLHSCFARLVTSPPFHIESQDFSLGDMEPDSLATASFVVKVDGNASSDDYQLGCMINCSERRTMIALPLTIARDESFLWRWSGPIFFMAIFATLAIILLKRGSFLCINRRRRR